jgi:subtilisin family serine protease
MRITFTLILCLVALAGYAQFDAPGIDPIFRRLQPNPFARLKNGANLFPRTPPRTEYYKPLSGKDTFSVALVYDRTSGGTISGGKLITPTQFLMGVPRLWKKGITGAGVKVMVIDNGYSGNVRHAALSIAGSYNQNQPGGNDIYTYTHTAQVLSIIGARNNDSAHMLGNAYEATLYAANVGNVANPIRWGLRQGCRVFCITLELNGDDTAIRNAVNEVHKAKGIVILAAGNMGGLPKPMQSGCKIPWIVCVGSTDGGGPLAFVDTFRTKQILPIEKNKLDFVLPIHNIVATFDSLNQYGEPVSVLGHDNTYCIAVGTSYTAPQIAGVFALLMDRYPKKSGSRIRRMLIKHGRTIQNDGIKTTMPDLSFVH